MIIFNKLQCDIGTIISGSSASYLQFILKASAALLSSVMYFLHGNSVLRNNLKELVPQTNYSELYLPHT